MANEIGVSPGEGTGATMSDDDDDDGDDDDDQVDSETNLFDGPDSMGFGPLIPTETERSLMERVRQELKHELKQVDSLCILLLNLQLVGLLDITSQKRFFISLRIRC